MDKKQTIAEHRKMWQWLAEHPDKKKQEYLKMFGYGYIYLECFCCKYTKTNFMRNGCDDCPIEWPHGSCTYESIDGLEKGLYSKWYAAFCKNDYGRASFFANEIANLPEKED